MNKSPPKLVSFFVLGSQTTISTGASQSWQDWRSKRFRIEARAHFSQECKIQEKSGSIQPSLIWKGRTLRELDRIVRNWAQFILKWEWFFWNQRNVLPFIVFSEQNFNANLFNTAWGQLATFARKWSSLKKRRSFQKKDSRSDSRPCTH